MAMKHNATELKRGNTFESTVLGAVSGEEDVREELLEGVSRVLGPVLHIVAHCRLQTFHELLGRGAQLLYDLVPLIDVCEKGVKEV